MRAWLPGWVQTTPLGSLGSTLQGVPSRVPLRGGVAATMFDNGALPNIFRSVPHLLVFVRPHPHLASHASATFPFGADP